MLFGEIFGPDLLVALFFVVVIVALVGISIWAIVDVASHSKEDFYSAGSSKTAWIVVIALFTVVYGFGSLIAIYYLVWVRPKVQRVEMQSLDSYRTSERHTRESAPQFCSNCGTRINTGAKFCSSCGSVISM
jgi:general stress protein CsbA